MQRRTRLICILVLACTLFVALSFLSSADTGPKPSVTVTFDGARDFGTPFYTTLLSSTPSTGPHSVWDGDEEHKYFGSEGEDVWRAFASYEDEDGYYFLQGTVRLVSDSDEARWGYYPPQKFKILIYNPATESFYKTDVCERYAFDSYFTVALTAESLDVCQTYDRTSELVGLAVRICITLVVELLLGYLLGVRTAGGFALLALINVLTQLGLNLALNALTGIGGETLMLIGYVVLEVLIVLTEAIAYRVTRSKLFRKPRSFIALLLFSLILNATSFATGIGIAFLFPQFF